MFVAEQAIRPLRTVDAAGRRTWGDDQIVAEGRLVELASLIEVRTGPAPREIAERLGVEEGSDVVVRLPRFVVDALPVQIVRVYYPPVLVAGSKLVQPVPIPHGVHGELRRQGVRVTRFVEELMGPRFPIPKRRGPFNSQVVCA